MKTAEEILKPYVERIFRHTEVVEKDNAIKAMREFEKQQRKADVVERSKLLKAFTKYCESRQIEPKRFSWDEIIEDFESL